MGPFLVALAAPYAVLVVPASRLAAREDRTTGRAEGLGLRLAVLAFRWLLARGTEEEHALVAARGQFEPGPIFDTAGQRVLLAAHFAKLDTDAPRPASIPHKLRWHR